MRFNHNALKFFFYPLHIPTKLTLAAAVHSLFLSVAHSLCGYITHFVYRDDTSDPSLVGEYWPINSHSVLLKNVLHFPSDWLAKVQSVLWNSIFLCLKPTLWAGHRIDDPALSDKRLKWLIFVNGLQDESREKLY